MHKAINSAYEKLICWFETAIYHRCLRIGPPPFPPPPPSSVILMEKIISPLYKYYCIYIYSRRGSDFCFSNICLNFVQWLCSLGYKCHIKILLKKRVESRGFRYLGLGGGRVGPVLKSSTCGIYWHVSQT